MTSPTREQILAAHYATEQLALLATSITERHDVKDYREMILKALPPKPQPTMADVEWDDDKHYLAEARQTFCGKVIMLGKDDDGFIKFLVPNFYESGLDVAPPISFTLTGKRYALTEVQE